MVHQNQHEHCDENVKPIKTQHLQVYKQKALHEIHNFLQITKLRTVTFQISNTGYDYVETMTNKREIVCKLLTNMSCNMNQFLNHSEKQKGNSLTPLAFLNQLCVPNQKQIMKPIYRRSISCQATVCNTVKNYVCLPQKIMVLAYNINN